MKEKVYTLRDLKVLERQMGGYITYPMGLDIELNIPIIAEMAREISARVPRSDLLLCCRGSSGAMIAAILASQVEQKVTILHFKKDGEFAHSPGLPYGIGNSDCALIVDDFASSGRTINAINKKFNERYGRNVDGICLSHINAMEINFKPKFIMIRRK